MKEFPVWVKFELKAENSLEAENKVCEALRKTDIDVPFKVVLKMDANVVNG